MTPRPDRMPPQLIEARRQSQNEATAATLRVLSECMLSLAEAMEDGDEILGVLAGGGVANHLTALPKHVRDVFMEYLSDDAAAGLRADRRYFEEYGHAA